MARHLAAAALMALVATAAQAGEAPRLKAYDLQAPLKAQDLVKAQPARASSFAEANALRAAGIARTSVDRRFGDERTTGSLGFVCGLQPNSDYSGGASAYGSDPHGRFLGAKFSRAF